MATSVSLETCLCRTSKQCLPGGAQVDFGAVRTLLHPDGRVRHTWAFVMTLVHSRHQYIEFV